MDPPTGGQSDNKPAKKGFLDWQLERYYDRDLPTAVMFSQQQKLRRRPSSCIADLLQNCDLPPPLNLYSPIQQDDDDGGDKKNPPLSSPRPSPSPSHDKNGRWDDGSEGLNQGGDNPSLMRALQLSQTRAREAERKAAIETVRNEQMTVLLLDGSLRLSAHQRWVKLLEIEVTILQEHRVQLQTAAGKQEEQRDEYTLPAAAATWCLAVALCLGIAGVGLALGRYI